MSLNGDSPLHVAVREGQIEDVREILIQQQVDVNVLNCKQETPLHLACSKNDSPIVQLLVAFGADPFIKDSNNENTYDRGGFDVGQLMAKLLFYHDFRLWIDGPIQADKDGPLHTAVRFGRLDDIQSIIEEGIVDINDTNANHETPLHLACALGNKHIVHILISNGADIYKKDYLNNAPIHRAVSQGHIDTVDYLITDCACNPNIKGYQGRTLLHFACGVGNVKFATTLIEKYGISPMATDAVNQTPLHIAASHGQEEVVCLLINKYNSLESTDFSTLLCLACYCGHVSVVKTLVLEYYADVYESVVFSSSVMGGSIEMVQLMITEFDQDPLLADDSGNTPLHIACWCGHEELARLLITKYNYPVNNENKNKETPLQVACSSGHSSIVEMLVSEFKADATQRDHNNDTAISKAARGGHVETVQALITELGCSPEVTGYDGRSLLHEACLSGSIKLAEMLIIDFSFDILSNDDSGNTPLHMACWGSHQELIRLLIIKYNCPVDLKNKINETPLHKACCFGHLSVVRMLISEFDADKAARNYQSSTPLGVAVLGGQVSIVQVLITEFDCSPHVKGFKGRSLLHFACEKGHTKLVMILMTDFKLDPLLVDDSGNTPLHMACWGGHEELARLLIIKYNHPVDVKNEDKQTPLHMACSCGHLNISKLLLSECMLVSRGDKRFYNALDKRNNTPLDLLIKKEDTKAVHTLSTEYGCKPHVRGVESKPLLHQLAAGGFTTVLQELISKFNYDPACSDEDGNTILHIAAQHGQYEIAEVVITNHSNQIPIDHRNCRGSTALHYACMYGHARVAKLIANNALGDKDEEALVDECGNTLLHIAARHGQYEITKFLIADYSNQCPIDHRNSRGQTALHCACIGGHTRVAKFLVANKADIAVRDEGGDTPLKKAFLVGHALTLCELFNCNVYTIDHKLLRQVCKHGSVDLIDVLLSDFNLHPSSSLDDQGNKAIHIAALQGHRQIIALLVEKYKCPIDSRNFKGRTPLHLLCSQSPTENGHALISMCVSEFQADMTAKDNSGNQPIHAAVQAGYTSTVINLISDHHYSTNSRGIKKRSLLHIALAMGHTSTAKTLIDDYHLSLHIIDEDGNTPLHLSSLVGQTESLRFLLYEYHAPVYVRNKAGKIALDLAIEDSTKKVIREYVKSEHKRIQREYDKLRAKSLQKYSGQQVITRVFVVGNPGSGKSTLVESLKRKGLSYYLNVPEADVKLHTAGIIPSTSQSSAGRLLYYDFAGDQEYFSSHAAILEMVSRSTVGSNVFLIVADLTKDDTILQNEIGYWISFISYHVKALDSQCKLKVIIVLSHLDRLGVADSDSKLDSARQCLHTHINQCNKVKFDVEIVSSNCRSPRSSKSVETILQQISKDTPPCSISYEASLLHGILEKDFSNVIACKFQKLLSSIEETGIYLPSSANALHPIVRELHDIGLLMLIGRNEDELEKYLLLLNPSSLTNEVHEKLFSSSAVKKLESSIGPHFANMGILPESYLARLLPEHITKECLVQLQYCQEFTCADVGLDSSGVSNSASEKNLLYFPALCKLDSEQSNWPTDPRLNFSIGWYAKCTEKFDYFSARVLHVLLLRLAFAFALPIANCNITESNEISAQNRRCTMWKNGIRWLMEEGVECIVEVVNDNKGIAVITKSKEGSKEWAGILSEIINKTLQAKAEFCSTVSLYHFLLKSDNTSSFMNEDKLFEITEIERVIKEGKKGVVSVSGRAFLDSSHLDIFRKYSFWAVVMSVEEDVPSPA